MDKAQEDGDEQRRPHEIQLRTKQNNGIVKRDECESRRKRD